MTPLRTLLALAAICGISALAFLASRWTDRVLPMSYEGEE